MLQATLTHVENDEQTELSSVTIIGRSPESNVVVRDPRVSRRHAMIRKQDDGFWFFDLGSFNGSYLNGSRVTTSKKLADGDTLEFAENHYKFTQTGKAFDDDSMSGLGGSTVALIRSKPTIILVSDIQGFTTLSEKLPPDEVAQTIGGWYGACERILAGHGATVDKFIGDCVLAYWTETEAAQRVAALKAAAELQNACREIYAEKSDVFDAFGLGFDSGVALHLGMVAYGGMSQGEFTLIGDPVNLTFRMETLTRSLESPVIVSGDYVRGWDQAKDFVKNLGIHPVKGRAQPVEVWGVHSFPE